MIEERFALLERRKAMKLARRFSRSLKMVAVIILGGGAFALGDYSANSELDIVTNLRMDTAIVVGIIFAAVVIRDLSDTVGKKI